MSNSDVYIYQPEIIADPTTDAQSRTEQNRTEQSRAEQNSSSSKLLFYVTSQH